LIDWSEQTINQIKTVNILSGEEFMTEET